MDDERYYRALDAAVELAAFVRERPDAAEHEVISRFVFTILAAIAGEPERYPVAHPCPSLN